jgi:hypothetical protein
MINGIEDINIEDHITFNDNTTRGHIFQIEKVRCYKTLRLQSFPHRCIDDWNNLPEDIVISETVVAFKTKLDKYWVNKRFELSEVY